MPLDVVYQTAVIFCQDWHIDSISITNQYRDSRIGFSGDKWEAASGGIQKERRFTGLIHRPL